MQPSIDRNARRAFLRTALGLGVSSLVLTRTADAAPAPSRAAVVKAEQGVLLELFTSQGCHSCPPADAILGGLAKAPGVVGLSLNVDYWDRLGWTDPLGRRAHTRRQYGYAYALRRHGVFTPQLIVQGAQSAVGGDPRDVARALGAVGVDDSLTIDIRSDGAKSTASLSGPVGRGERLLVMAAPYRQTVTQAIPAGENRGKTLTYSNAALEVRRLGAFDGADVSFALALPRAADGVAVWAQQTTPYGPFGAVRGAAKLEF